MELTDEPREPTHWIVVGSTANVWRTAELGFTVQGITSRHRKKAERMGPGDKSVYSPTGIKGFGGIATVESPFFASHEPIWASADPQKAVKDDPFRVRISPDLALSGEDTLPAEPLARGTASVATWPAANRTLAFQRNVHEIGADDDRPIRRAIAARIPATGERDGRRVA